MKIAILLYRDVDLLDSGGPYEVFLTAARLLECDGSNHTFTVATVSLEAAPIIAYGGMGLIPQGSLQDTMDADVLIVPGTIDIELAIANKDLIGAISSYANQQGGDKIVASVYTGAFLLAESGCTI